MCSIQTLARKLHGEVPFDFERLVWQSPPCVETLKAAVSQLEFLSLKGHFCIMVDSINRRGDLFPVGSAAAAAAGGDGGRRGGCCCCCSL